jgi:hypothetical protein
MDQIEFDEATLFCAFRYALGRRSYITGIIAKQLIKYWDLLRKSTKILIVKSISRAIEKNEAGDHLNTDDWLKVILHNQLEEEHESL